MNDREPGLGFLGALRQFTNSNWLLLLSAMALFMTALTTRAFDDENPFEDIMNQCIRSFTMNGGEAQQCYVNETDRQCEEPLDQYPIDEWVAFALGTITATPESNTVVVKGSNVNASDIIDIATQTGAKLLMTETCQDGKVQESLSAYPVYYQQAKAVWRSNNKETLTFTATSTETIDITMAPLEVDEDFNELNATITATVVVTVNAVGIASITCGSSVSTSDEPIPPEWVSLAINHGGGRVSLSASPTEGSTWPTGYPKWENVESSSGADAFIDTSVPGRHIVKAMCGNSIYIEIVVYKMSKIRIEFEDQFPNRSNVAVGIRERASMYAVCEPAESHYPIGDTVWTVDGDATIQGDFTGLGMFEAGLTRSTVKITAIITDQLFFGEELQAELEVLPPFGSKFLRKEGTGIAHQFGKASIGIKGVYVTVGVDAVSFYRLSRREGGGTPTTKTGLFANVGDHPIGNWMVCVHRRDLYSPDGTRDVGLDTSWFTRPPPFKESHLVLPIDIEYLVDGNVIVKFDEMVSDNRISIDGTARKQKGDCGPFEVLANAPTSDY